MKLLEYEAKQLLKNAEIAVPSSMIIANTDTSLVVLPVVLKSQVPVGGRGKAGGVVVVEDQEKLPQATNQLLHLSIEGYLPRKLLAEEKLHIKRELYLSLSLDHAEAAIIMTASNEGGVHVEDRSQPLFVRSISLATVDSLSVEVSEYFKLDVSHLIVKLLNIFSSHDAVLLEINPLVETIDGQVICGDCKMELDDNAAFRHPEWDFEDKPKNTNFVTLNENGTIATIANGAGLAMATVDAVAAASLTPANFLDIGGGANEASVTKAFESILEYPHIKAIIINIFAGITRCDEVAKAIIAAKKSFPNLPPLFIRLDGTNYDEAKAILDQAHINLLPSLEDCLKAAQEVSL